MNRLHPAALAIVFVAMLSGCGQKEPSQQEPDCKSPGTQEEKQKCAHKESTEPRIAPTEKPKNWLDVKP
jgi:predicted small lipoprotein YifL